MLRRKQVCETGQRGWHPPRNERSHFSVACVLMGFVIMTVCMVVVTRHPTEPEPSAFTVAASKPVTTQKPALPSHVIQGFPSGETGYTIAIQEDRLKNGRMLLVNDTHPLPENFVPPASYNILQRAKGRIACRDAQAVLAGDAIDALDELFRNARYARHNNMVVFASCRSEEQQRIALMDRMSDLSRSMSFEDALAKVKVEIEIPGCSEHQLPWCIDIRICSAWNALPDETPLSASEAGRWLISHAWEYGFIQRYPDAGTDSHRAWHFRYVGKAHAAMVHALGASFEEYLLLMREYGVLTLLNDAGQPAVTVICQQARIGDTRFTLPLHGTVEDVSLDNCGWALVSCLYH